MGDLFGLHPFGTVPSERQLEHLKAGKKAFFHFGVNTFTDMEWGLGEEKESIFDPTQTDCRQWIRKIKAAGFEIAILTAKHHDGFCLWPSEYTKHSVKNSPYKDGQGDLVREFTDACREFGVKAGLYLSPWDRHAPYWGQPEYNQFYVSQLTELLTNYGEIHEVWWDGAGSQETPYDWGLWAYTVRNLQPKAGIFGSMGATPYVEFRWVGNESGYAGDPCYETIDPEFLEVENRSVLNSGVFGGCRFIPAEVDVSIRPGWFYHADQDEEVKSSEDLVRIWYQSIGRGQMLLLNFPPDRRGLLPDQDTQNAIRAHQIVSNMLSVNLAADGEAVSNQERCRGCEAQNILTDQEECFFAASEGTEPVVIRVKLPEIRTFNTFLIGEYIPLGVRINGYRISAKVDGEWMLIKEKQSMGYFWAEYFDEVSSDEIQIEIFDFAAPPVIRHFGLYQLGIDLLAEERKCKEGKDLVKGNSARVVYQPDGAIVEFGGIYPFTTVVFNGNGIWNYTLFAFDGSNYYEVYKGVRPKERQEIRLEEPITGSYQIKLVTGIPGDETLDISVY